MRSPRRDAAARAREARAEKAAAATPAQAAAPDAEPEDEREGTSSGVEDVARAGVATAAQVATAGLRFAGRAAGAIRESLERR